MQFAAALSRHVGGSLARNAVACSGAPRVRRGITLVELAVAMGILAALIAIAVPTLKTVAAAARATKCQTNLRTMTAAVYAYSAQNRDALPAAILYRIRPGGIAIDAWDFTHGADGSVTPGTLWAFTDSPLEVLQCPEFLGAATFGDEPFTGYNYNTSYLGAEGHFPTLDRDGQWIDGWRGARRGVPVAGHRRASETAVFGDAGWKGGANKFMRAPSNSVENDLGTIYAGGQAFRHPGACTHVAYLDGHVGACMQCCEGEHATDALLEGIMGFPRNGFLSDDDAAYDPR